VRLLDKYRTWNTQRKINSALRSMSWMGSGGYVPSAPVLSGTFVTPETALGIAAVYSAINVIATDIATLPRNVYRRQPDGGRQIEESSYLGDLNQLLSVQPNDDMDAFKWCQDSMGHVLGRGNGMSEIVRKKGFVQSLEMLHPAKTQIKRTETTSGRIGRLFYELDNHRTLWPDDVLHFAGMGFNGVVGFSPISLMRQTIGLAMGAEQFGASFFGNGAIASGWLKLAKKLSQVAQENLRGTFNQRHQGSQSAHQIGILEEGMEWVPNQISPQDAQMILTREFQVKDIARIFRIPPHKIGDYSESHLANVEEANIDYVAMTLLGWVSMLEAQLNVKLLTREQRQTHTIGINMSSLLRGNIAARVLKMQAMRNTGAWSADDIRKSEGENPLPAGSGGDKYVIQSQYIPLDQLGKQPVQPMGPGKPPPNDTKHLLEILEARMNHENGVAA
jgi:HK97 family phage portal protein